MPRTDLKSSESNAIRDDIIRKTGIDIFKLMQRNYELLIVTGHSDNPGIQFTFIITVVTVILTTSMRVFIGAGLNRAVAQEMLNIISKAVMEAVGEAEAAAKAKEERE